MSDGLTLHLAEDLDVLLKPFGDFVFSSPGAPLEAPWAVVPNLSLRQWMDQELSRLDPSGFGGVTANLFSIFPKDLTVRLEQMALGDEWQDWGLDPTALRILGVLKLPSYDDARRRAEMIDEIVRWRPHLLEVQNHGLIPDRAYEAMEALEFFAEGPHLQRATVLARLSSGLVEDLPPQLAIFGLPDVPSGRRFLDLIAAVASQIPVHCFLPVPSVGLAHEVFTATEPEVTFPWQRDAREALRLWRSLDPHVEVLEGDGEGRVTELAHLQRRLASGVDSQGALSDDTVKVLGGFGDARQAEQVRDAIFDAIDKEDNLELHEILVVSPDPTAFAAALERHWNYQNFDEDDGPRLPYELIDVAPDRLRNRLGASLALLRLIGGYVTVEQVADLLCYPSVSATLNVPFDATQELVHRANEGKLIFGVSSEQRARFDVYPTDPSSGFPCDMGTWERVSDAVAAATLYPPRVDIGSRVPGPIDAVGEPGDLELFGKIQPILRIIEQADRLRPPLGSEEVAERRSLRAWLAMLSEWMNLVAANHGEDDSFERLVMRLERALEVDPELDDLTMTFEQMLELWTSLAQARRYSRIFGKRGVVIGSLDALAYAPFKVIVILGLDEEKLPAATLTSPVMAQLPPGQPEGTRPDGDPDRRRTMLGGLLAAVCSARARLIVSWNVADESTGGEVDAAVTLAELLDAIAATENTSSATLVTEQYARARRHNFIGLHVEPRFDERLFRINPSTPRGVGPKEVERADRVEIGDLQSFFRDPVGRHLRHTENVIIPSTLEAQVARPAVEVDNLTMSSLREAFAQGAMGLPEWRAIVPSTNDAASYHKALETFSKATVSIFEQICADEEYAGDVPSMFWLDADLKDRLDLFCFNLAFDLADHEEVNEAESDELADIDLGELGQLNLLSAHGFKEARFTPQRYIHDDGVRAVLHWRAKEGDGPTADASNIVLRLIDLLALRVNTPEAECRVITYFAPKNISVQGRNMSKEAVPKGAYRLNPSFELRATPESLPAEAARSHLATLMALYRRGLEEILPIFRSTSVAAGFLGFSEKTGFNPSSRWEGVQGGRAESQSVVNTLLFPFSYRELDRETTFTSLARELGGAGRGVGWRWGTAVRRPASNTLLGAHSGFSERDAAVLDMIAKAELGNDGDELGRLGRQFTPLTSEDL